MYKTTCALATKPTLFRMYIEAVLPGQRAVCRNRCRTKACIATLSG